MPFEITKTLDEHKAEAVAAINQMAGERILAKYPVYKQLNMTARAAELLPLIISPERLPLDTVINSPELDNIKTAWEWINSIRDMSNNTNTAIMKAKNVADICALLKKFQNL
jgi:antitoxin component of RelBE/YafQ-DinJ toxin-antitoxin module